MASFIYIIFQYEEIEEEERGFRFNQHSGQMIWEDKHTGYAEEKPFGSQMTRMSDGTTGLCTVLSTRLTHDF